MSERALSVVVAVWCLIALGITFGFLLLPYRAAVIYVIVVGLLWAAGFAWWYWMDEKDRARWQQRGFEVKSSTGQTPVLAEKKENDHG